VALQLTRHAQDRMRQRGISAADVEAAAARPVRRPTPGGPGSRWVFGYAPDGRILKVCLSTLDPNTVITVVWAS
jgi:hypothetical protein